MGRGCVWDAAWYHPAQERWIREHPVGANKNNNSLFSDIYLKVTEFFVVRGNLSVLKGGQRMREILAACDHISSYLRDASTAQGPVVVGKLLLLPASRQDDTLGAGNLLVRVFGGWNGMCAVDVAGPSLIAAITYIRRYCNVRF